MDVHERRALPEGWEWKRLGDVCEKSEYGYTTSAKSEGTGPLFLRTTDISYGDIHWHSVPFCAEPPTDEERYCLKDGDILISRAGSVGMSVVIRNPPRSIFASYLIRFRPRKELIPSYAGFFLKSNLYWVQLGSKTAGTTLPGVNATNLSNVKIPLPPLPIQRRIVSILEKAEETKKLRAQADELTDRLLQSVFLEMFGDPVRNPKGWEVKRLEAICSEIYRYPTFYGFEYSKNGVPVVRINNIFSKGSLDPNISNYVFIEPSLNKNFPRTILEFNDIVMAVRGDGSTAKRIGLVNTINLVGANISPNLIRFKANAVILNPFYLFKMMTSYSGQKLLEKYVTRTAKKTITAKDIKEIPIPLPPLPLQQEFARIVEKIEAMRQSQNQSKQQIEDLFSALMQKAFRGDLDKSIYI